MQSRRCACPLPEAHTVAAPEPVALAAGADADTEEQPSEGVRVLTPPAPPEPEPEQVEPAVEVTEVVVVEAVVVEDEEGIVEVAIVEEIVTEETPVVPGDPTIDEAVDELFVASARPSRRSRQRRRGPRRGTLGWFSGAEGSVEPPSAKETSEPDEPDTSGPDVFEQRSAALAPLQTSLARKLRRVLADDQNEVLDRLRQGSKLPDLDALVGSPEDHSARYAGLARGDLDGAACAGCGDRRWRAPRGARRP